MQITIEISKKTVEKIKEYLYKPFDLYEKSAEDSKFKRYIQYVSNDILLAKYNARYDIMYRFEINDSLVKRIFKGISKLITKEDVDNDIFRAISVKGYDIASKEISKSKKNPNLAYSINTAKDGDIILSCIGITKMGNGVISSVKITNDLGINICEECINVKSISLSNFSEINEIIDTLEVSDGVRGMLRASVISMQY